MSYTIPFYEKYFEYAGIILAKSIVDKTTVNVSLTRSLLKHLLGKKIAIDDLEDMDPDMHRSMKFILETNDDVEDLCLSFTYETKIFNETATRELIDDGYDTTVDELNKKDYVKKFCEAVMIK
eukprot:CAMPEP_0114601852 /NCGR_PEP_ID=MMETSP0125-20121206/24472_1 /TAXON_ID=485358 ORGANISM="Aristerostoma sp., Strain ATCC 50986" /NCGR_SAMPLE_ID=MMETSP0125 /ASSEMBLY_ACC=CAM_ASM_000245 /LENGTH=122 /DNA_ID=CAMNT_0001811497 /DNA_START=1152 /DNA_END=1520 /DNA_ORIENTATION=+